MQESISYADAGVSIDEANLSVSKIKLLAKTTFNEKTLTEIGSFGGMFLASFENMQEPVLVASADGVGTKLKIAFQSGIHDTIGQDLVNHCVNDILVQGAKPLFFLDYFATGKLKAETLVSVVKGITEACRQNGCVLLGGETAEMPGFYSEGEYDLAGFIVGVVDRKKIIDGRKIQEGDVVLGIRSNGLHTNGYSLARKILFEIGKYGLDDYVEDLGEKLVDSLLRIHKSYLADIERFLDSEKIKGLAHITGGGLVENIPRILPNGVSVYIDRKSWEVPPIFALIQRLGKVSQEEMFRTFNMGIGMVLICTAKDKELFLSSIENCFEIGEVIKGDRKVIF
ncbi:MAG: phosphoribosylformylglycinamidine cyclo-ligase [Pyrinomonadaceae bacterium]|nr:phosphoribosylformylglycinamidine cyclo-ligase [Pyrinomonadaceae bacterium]MCX7639120.1 phosphoribosylformylglycinamidine cyclo-ligase [Pyrinomonadaceae bacterium]MDW8303659.1 phosphoribosylformylglycinamidine cyclo-ligase [Acidobacteriota bacterium]